MIASQKASEIGSELFPVNTLRVLVVDDSASYRRLLADLLAEIPSVEVVGSASNGRIALQKLGHLRPDLLVLDVEMPEMDGLEVLRRLRAVEWRTGAIVLSDSGSNGSRTTLTALELGAFDFIVKPDGHSLEQTRGRLGKKLRTRLEAFAHDQQLGRLASTARERMPESAGNAALATPVEPAENTPEIVAIGISTGGPTALAEMLPLLPADFPVPVLIVQHMPPVFTRSLAEDLHTRCKLSVVEARDGQTVEPRTVLIAPGGRQMRVEDGSPAVVRISDDPAENSCKPSVDYLFRSVAQVYGGRSVGVIMTGIGKDGTAGCRQLKRLGGTVIAQDEASCAVFGMPKPLVEEGLADLVAPLDQLADRIVRAVGHAGRA